MPWIVAGTAYTAGYVALMWVLAPSPAARLWAGNIGLLVSPLVPIVVILRRRREWSGPALVFWGAIAIGCALWLFGQAAWSEAELARHQLLPWLEWPMAVKLCGGMLPMFALVAWPHRPIRGASPASICLDLCGLAVMSAFLCWSLIVAPGLAPAAAPFAIRSLLTVSMLVYAAIIGSFVYAGRSADPGAWRTVYNRCALGAALGILLLTPNIWAMFEGRYATGAPGDIGWIVPFWLYALAAAQAPASLQEAPTPLDQWQTSAQSGLLLLGTVAVVPLIGYVPRYLLSLGQPIDRYRDVVTSLTLAAGCALAVSRTAVEQRARRRADYRMWLLATACEQCGELIVIIRQNAVEYANHAFRSAFGYSLDQLRDIAPASLVADTSAAGVSEIVVRLRRGDVAPATLDLQRRDGTTFQAHCTVAPIVSASGRTAYFVGVVRDLTDELRMREQLVRSERMSAVGELVSKVAHEINNPLQLVIGVADLLMKRPIDAEAHADVAEIRAGAERVGQVVRKLMTFAHRAPQNRELLDLNDLVRQAASVSARDLAAWRIDVSQHHGDRLPPVYVNRVALLQVFVALIRNAGEAMSRANGGGLLGLRTHVSLSGAAVLEVVDDGPGVPESAAPRIFEPFFTTKRDGHGAGLGLTLAFGIVRSHGGVLELVPSDRGACFRVTLPAAAVNELTNA